MWQTAPCGSPPKSKHTLFSSVPLCPHVSIKDFEHFYELIFNFGVLAIYLTVYVLN